MLTVEIRDVEKGVSKAEVEIFCDARGLALLTQQLEHLRQGAGHVHFMTTSWAGTELDERPVGKGTSLINHLRITLISESK